MKNIFFCAAMAVLLLCGCTGERVWRIGVSQCSDDDWRTKMNDEIRREALFHDNIEVEIRSADDDNERQAADIRYFAENKFDIIVCAPNEADALTPVIKEVYESGIPVVLFDRNINGESYTSWQGADNVEIGRMAAQYAYSLMGGSAENTRVIEIYGLEGSTPAIERHEGFRRTADSLGVTVLGGMHGNWVPGDGAKAARELLTQHPEANVIYAHNDRMAIAASGVAREMGRTDVRVIGIDAMPSTGIRAVEEGEIDATFIYPTDGDRLIQTALDILEGRPCAKRVVLPLATAVDKANAKILQMQYAKLQEETERIGWLKEKIDSFWQQYNMQQVLLYSVLVIMVLLAVLLYLILRSHRVEATQKREIMKQRDELDDLYKRLQEATASKLSFFTNVSHDLRTPLTLIADPVEQLTRADNLTAQQHTLMQLANKNVKRLMRLINQIMDIRKHDSVSLSLTLHTIDVAAAMREWVASFAVAARKNHLKMVSEIPADMVARTAVDIEKLERIVFNLIANAFKFTPQGGTVTVGMEADGKQVTVSVRDTGRGIPREELSQVFDQFFRSEEANPSGSGIGLALAKMFVDMHGGEIRVESEQGKGTAFIFSLPVRTDAPEFEAGRDHWRKSDDALSMPMAQIDELVDIDDEELTPTKDAPTVLIIDDNADIRTLVRSTMCDHYVVAQAQSGAQGIRMATKYIPDLIICDVMMPDMDGYETCRRLKAEVITSHIPVLMLTAATGDEERTAAYECGADGYMAKPFDHKMLTARCQNLIDKAQRMAQAGGESTAAPKATAEKKVPATKSEGWSGVDSEFYQRFERIVEKHLSDSDFSVEDIADEIGMSRVQLYRKLKALTNFSPADLQRIMRLRRAAHLLKTTEHTISEVAYSVGFSSPSYFTKCYRDHYGESPSDVQARTSKIK